MTGPKAVRSLFGVQFRMLVNLSGVLDAIRRDRKQLMKLIGFGFLMLYALGVLFLMYGFLLYPLMQGAVEIGMAAPLLALAALVCMTVTLIFGVVNLLGFVFQAKDTEFLFALPLTQRSIFTAKFLMVYLLEWLISMLIFLPALALYAWFTPVDWPSFIPAALLVSLLLPAAPLAVSALLSSLFMRLSVLSRRRDLFVIIGGFLLVAASVFGQSRLQAWFGPSMMDGNAGSLLSDNAELLRIVAGAFPPALWAAEALTLGGGTSWLSLTHYTAVSLAALAFSIWFCGLLFARAGTAHLESARPKTAQYRSRETSARPAVLALVLRDWKLLLRTPVYALNALTSALIFPLLIVIMPLISEGYKAAFDLSALMAQAGIPSADKGLVFAAFFAFLSFVNPAATTAVSREGRTFWLTRVLPLPPWKQTLSRFLTGYSVALLAGLVSVLCFWFALRLDPSQILAGLLVSLPVSASISAVSSIPDMLRPKLRWTNESEAIKQNMNAFLGMLLALPAAAPPVLAALGLRRLVRNAAGLTALIFFVSLLWSAVCLGLMFRAGKQTARIES